MTHAQKIEAAANEIAASSDGRTAEQLRVYERVLPILKRHLGYREGVPKEPGEHWWGRHKEKTNSRWTVFTTYRGLSGGMLLESRRWALHLETALKDGWEFCGPISPPETGDTQ